MTGGQGSERLANPAGQKLNSGNHPKISPEQADKIAKLILHGTDAADVDAKIKRILHPVQEAPDSTKRIRNGENGQKIIPNPSLSAPITEVSESEVVSFGKLTKSGGDYGTKINGEMTSQKTPVASGEQDSTAISRSLTSTAAKQVETTESLKSMLVAVKAEIANSPQLAAVTSAQILATTGNVDSRDRLLAKGNVAGITSNGGVGEVEESSDHVSDVKIVTHVEPTQSESELKPVVGKTSTEDSDFELEISQADFVKSDSGKVSGSESAQVISSSTKVESVSSTQSATVTVGEVKEIVREVADLIAARNPGKIEVKMMPEDLGSIDIAIRQRSGRVEVDMKASDERVHHALQSGRSDMVQHLESKGIVVTSVNVDRDLSGFEMNKQNQSQSQNQTSRQDFERAMNMNHRYFRHENDMSNMNRSLLVNGVNYLV